MFVVSGIFYIFLSILLITPLILTLLNIINLFKKKKIKENLVDKWTFSLGIVLTIFLYLESDFLDYTQALQLGGLQVSSHSPIASWSMPTVLTIFLLGIVSYYLIRTKKIELPPLIIVCAMSGILICSIYIIIFLIQICNKNIIENAIYGLPYLIIFPINYILCAIRAELEIIKRYKQKEIIPKMYNNKLLNKCSEIFCDADKWPFIAVIFCAPILIILLCILVLFGQRPDEAIKAFLETSDWTLSTKISPPPVTNDGHYLCTVSLKGHKKLVKPTRIGIRRGEKIIVNRQLCIANAFEDLIKERTPKFHHFVRYIYDKYGFPLSKHINNTWQADITYILMKPLEWIFLIVLYLFDKNPENRIATQYIGTKVQIIK